MEQVEQVVGDPALSSREVWRQVAVGLEITSPPRRWRDPSPRFLRDMPAGEGEDWRNMGRRRAWGNVAMLEGNGKGGD